MLMADTSGSDFQTRVETFSPVFYLPDSQLWFISLHLNGRGYQKALWVITSLLFLFFNKLWHFYLERTVEPASVPLM